jgi:hypothetical protein
VHEQVLEQVTVPNDGKQPALIEYLSAAGFSTTRIVVHDVSVIEHGSGDTEIDWVRISAEETKMVLVVVLVLACAHGPNVLCPCVCLLSMPSNIKSTTTIF